MSTAAGRPRWHPGCAPPASTSRPNGCSTRTSEFHRRFFSPAAVPSAWLFPIGRTFPLRGHRCARGRDRRTIGGMTRGTGLRLAVALDGAGWHPAAWRSDDARPTEVFGAGYWLDLVREAQAGTLDFV